ncbi:MAG: hypothetical protein WED09_07415 [Homoserinimonas sp.]
MEDVDVESIEHLDFEVPCSLQVKIVLLGAWLPGKPKKCEEPAVELITCRKCARTGTVCGPHGRWLRVAGNVSCQCGLSGAGVVVFGFKPLGGA